MTADSNANQNKTSPSGNVEGGESHGASGGGGQGAQDGPSPSGLLSCDQRIDRLDATADLAGA